MTIKKLFKRLQLGIKYINVKTIYFNFKYLPFRQAIKIPILIANNVHLLKAAGAIHISGRIEMAMIQIGYGDVGLFSEKTSKGIWDCNGTVVFKGKCSLGMGSRISIRHGATIEFGNNFVISAASSICSVRSIVFGNDVLLSWDVLVMDTDFHQIVDKDKKVLNRPEKIQIGNKVWIGSRCMVLKGVQIPDGCIIAACSLVNSVLQQEKSLYGGSPAKLLKENIDWSDAHP